MSLYEALRQRGYSSRQHLEEQGWTQRKLTVVDLDDSLRAALEHGGVDGPKQVLDSHGLWSFPALDTEGPLNIQPDVILAEHGRAAALVVAPGSVRLPDQMASELPDELQQRFGVLSLFCSFSYEEPEAEAWGVCERTFHRRNSSPPFQRHSERSFAE